MEQILSWEANGHSANQISCTEGSLPCSQDPVTGPYHELDFFKIYCNIIFPHSFVQTSGLFPFKFSD
jgi:hypothetical protein